MKKEWMYFIAGAGLAVAIMFALNSGYSDYEDCVLGEAQKSAKYGEVDATWYLKYCLRYERN